MLPAICIQRLAQNRLTGILRCGLSQHVTDWLMQLRLPLLANLFGTLLVLAVPSYGQTDGRDPQTSPFEAWRKKIVIQLVSKREIPPRAIGQTGTAKIKFVINRQGKLTSTELVESTGSELLDAAAMRIVARAEPFPEPPAEVSDDQLTFTVPFVFTNRPPPGARREWPTEWIENERKVDTKIQGICRGC